MSVAEREREVACPMCTAEAGEPCLVQTGPRAGRVFPPNHTARGLAATIARQQRAWSEAAQAADIDRRRR